MNSKILAALAATSAAVILAACGGGGSSNATSATTTLSGVAAVGFPIVSGTVNVVCAGGSALTSPTSITGAWQVTLSGQTLPCAVQVSGGTINGVVNSTLYHSVATSLGTVNVTPLTDLLVANMAGVSPGTWFAGANSTTLTPINAAAVGAALTKLRTALALTQLNTIDPITLTFTAASGNAIDDMLAALKTAMTTTGVSYATLLTAATSSTFTPPAGLSAALTTAYSSTTSGGSGGSGVGCTGKVATLFANTKGSYSAAAITDGPDPTTPPANVAGFANGVSSPITVNSNCTITIGAISFTYKDGSYFESPGTGADVGKIQYDVDMTGAGVTYPHYEVFVNGKHLFGFLDPAVKFQRVSFGW